MEQDVGLLGDTILRFYHIIGGENKSPLQWLLYLMEKREETSSYLSRPLKTKKDKKQSKKLPEGNNILLDVWSAGACVCVLIEASGLVVWHRLCQYLFTARWRID